MYSSIEPPLREYLKSLTLLCVEDNKDTQFIYSSILEELFKKVVFASTGQEGYEAFLKNDIDIVITDYNLPIFDGLELIKKIRQHNQNIPILLVSAVEEIDAIVQIIKLNIKNFIKKPIDSFEIIENIVNITKTLLADKCLQTQNKKRIDELEAKNSYNSYQEELAFAKELNILRNDFYYKMHFNSNILLIDFFYKPLDTLSGDAYSARKINNDISFYFLIDGMGKGLSASLSTMIMTSYINHTIYRHLDDFNLKRVIEKSLEYIKPILLDEETLSLDFITINHKTTSMHYAKFGMPSCLLQTKQHQIKKIKSNNPPFSKYTNDFEIGVIDINDIFKFIFYTDGIVENSTRYDDKLYGDFIESDFLDSFTKDEFREKLLWRVDEQEDDMSFIFITQLDLQKDSNQKYNITYPSTLDAVDEANNRYSEIFGSLTTNHTLTYNASIAFNELFMNAYEHGNLAIPSTQKHKLMQEDKYFETLQKLQQECNKKIFVDIAEIDYNSNRYVITIIKDEGDGFDTQILSNIFRDKRNFNGRGVYISRQSSLGLYYSDKGDSVLFLHKL